MKEYDCVKVIRLLEEDRPFDGTLGVKRRPVVGDVGAIAHQYDNENFVVEKVDSEGYTFWLADFVLEELEVLEHN